jgi:hypothetical protein
VRPTAARVAADVDPYQTGETGYTNRTNHFSGNQERKQTNHVETEPGWTDLTRYP